MSPILNNYPPPKNPGVYIFKNAATEIIYIGKAKVLHNRVRTYFATTPARDPKTRQLIENITAIEYIITDNELEALILESVLIKKHKPKFNIKLRDDKNYQFIKIDYSLPIPQIYPVRKKEENLSRPGGARYFGPYTSGYNVRNTLRLIKKIFPICLSEKIGTRPCFNYQLHRCPGVCIGAVSKEEYAESLKRVELFLRGETKTIETDLKKQMRVNARRKNFEKAALLRDQLEALQGLAEHQKIITVRPKNQDYVGLYRTDENAAINLFIVRDGKLMGRENLLLENIDAKNDAEVLTAFLERYYLDATNLPNEIFIPTDIIDKKLFEKFLSLRRTEMLEAVHGKVRSRKVHINVPKRGTAKQLLVLSRENAREYLEQQKAKFEKEATDARTALSELQKLLGLKHIPARIEGFDISNIQGTSAVGSMVVFINGRPANKEYRKFRIRGKSTPDDYYMMGEILKRRLKNDWGKPDLWVIDGGKGQLGVALKTLEEIKTQIPVIALAKDREVDKVFVPQKGEPVILSQNSPALFLIQRLRDEAHRFAITYHRKLRSRRLLGAE